MSLLEGRQPCRWKYFSRVDHLWSPAITEPIGRRVARGNTKRLARGTPLSWARDSGPASHTKSHLRRRLLRSLTVYLRPSFCPTHTPSAPTSYVRRRISVSRAQPRADNEDARGCCSTRWSAATCWPRWYCSSIPLCCTRRRRWSFCASTSAIGAVSRRVLRPSLPLFTIRGSPAGATLSLLF